MARTCSHSFVLKVRNHALRRQENMSLAELRYAEIHEAHDGVGDMVSERIKRILGNVNDAPTIVNDRRYVLNDHGSR